MVYTFSSKPKDSVIKTNSVFYARVYMKTCVLGEIWISHFASFKNIT